MAKQDQLSLSGLGALVKAKTSSDTKQGIFQQELRALYDRVLALELEVSFLRILLENPRGEEQCK